MRVRERGGGIRATSGLRELREPSFRTRVKKKKWTRGFGGGRATSEANFLKFGTREASKNRDGKGGSAKGATMKTLRVEGMQEPLKICTRLEASAANRKRPNGPKVKYSAKRAEGKSKHK